jgi:spore coat polysaccharide biosynthesis protein SpsF
MKEVIAVIQSRYNSSRLPGKALLPLAGKPLIEHVIERSLLLKRVDCVILATGLSSCNDSIIEIAQKKNCITFQGPDDDVLKRFYDVTNTYKCKYVIRITGDNPFLDVDLGNKLIKKELSEQYDYLGMENIPIGIGLEIFKNMSMLVLI